MILSTTWLNKMKQKTTLLELLRMPEISSMLPDFNIFLAAYLARAIQANFAFTTALSLRGFQICVTIEEALQTGIQTGAGTALTPVCSLRKLKPKRAFACRAGDDTLNCAGLRIHTHANKTK